MNSTESASSEHLHRLLEKFRTAMLVTHTPLGEIRARPMAIAHVEADCGVWFFSGRSSGKIGEIEDDAQVSIVCQREHDIYLSISGRGTVSRDRAKVEELWNETYKTWFPQGKDDPDLTLIRIDPQEGEYWDNEGFNKIKYLFEAAKAYAKGDRPHVEEGSQHAKVAL